MAEGGRFFIEEGPILVTISKVRAASVARELGEKVKQLREERVIRYERVLVWENDEIYLCVAMMPRSCWSVELTAVRMGSQPWLRPVWTATVSTEKIANSSPSSQVPAEWPTVCQSKSRTGNHSRTSPSQQRGSRTLPQPQRASVVMKWWPGLRTHVIACNDLLFDIVYIKFRFERRLLDT